MAFGRRRSNKGTIIDSVKHEIRQVALLEDASVVKYIRIAVGRPTPDVTIDSDVKQGSVIKAIIFEINFNQEGNITQVIDWGIVKSPTGANVVAANYDPAIPNQETRSSVFLWGMEMPAGINNSSAIKRIGTLLIPKGKQRMAEDDEWFFMYRASGTGLVDVCSHFIYKEYR